MEEQEKLTNKDSVNDSSESVAEWAKVHEKWKTIRFVVICAAVLIGLWMILSSLREMLQIEPWVAVLALIASLIAPSAVFWRISGRFKAYLQKDHQRTIQLEAEIDATRQSSGLSMTGTEPKGEP